MKKSIYLLSISLLSLPIVSSISSCSCILPEVYNIIPIDYYNIQDNTFLNGFKNDMLEDDLSKYDTLQIPTNITKVGGFIYKQSYKSYKAIKKVIADNNGSWSTIEPSAFSNLPELTKIVLPKTISNIADYAFVNLFKLQTIDLSNISNISIIKSNQFNAIDISKVITNGTIIVSNNDHKNALINTFKDNKWLKGWAIVVK